MARIPVWRSALAGAGLWAVAWACTDRISAPGKCPDLCPADSVVLADTVLNTPVAFDTSIRGYTDVKSASILILSSLDSLSAFAFFKTSQLPQSWSPQTDTGIVTLGSLDSVQVQVFLQARDTSAKNLYILIYRLPASIDTSIDVVGASQLFADTNLVDSIPVPDSVSSGLLTRTVPKNRMVPLPEDSFTVAVGLRVRASTPTAVALLSSDLTVAPPRLFYYARGLPPRNTDSLTRSFELDPVFDTYLFAPAPVDPAPGTIVVGNQPAARALVRIQLPPYIADSVTVIRGTLVLRLARPVTGVPGQRLLIEAAPVLRLFGGKSIVVPDTTTYGYGTVTVGDTGSVRIELAPVLRTWRGTNPDSLPRVIVLRAYSESLNVGEVTASGALSGASAPQLVLTIMRPFKFGVP
jgi:hypothetical protein